MTKLFIHKYILISSFLLMRMFNATSSKRSIFFSKTFPTLEFFIETVLVLPGKQYGLSRWSLHTQIQSRRGKQRYISTKSQHRSEFGECGHRHTMAALHTGKNPGTLFTEGWMGPKAGLYWYGENTSCLHRCSNLRPPTRSQSLYRLSYPGPLDYQVFCRMP